MRDSVTFDSDCLVSLQPMTRKITLGVFVYVFSVGACLIYRATNPSVLETSFQPASREIAAPTNHAPPEEVPQTPKIDLAAGISADSNVDPERSIAQARSTRRDSLRRLLRQINDAMQARDPAARDRFQTLLAELVRSQPEAAARFAESLEVGEAREEALRRVAQCWTAQDPTGAERWAAQLISPSERASALSDMCFQIAQTNAAQALFKAEQYGLGTAPGAVLENLTQQWAGQDFYSAANWVEQQPAGEQRDQMLSRLAFVQSATAPSEAVKMVVDQIPPGPIQTEAAISVLHQWALHDLTGARSWVELFPAGPVRDRADTELDNVAAYQNPNQ